MGILSLLGINSGNDRLKEALESGAIIVDVRTKAEYNSGHLKGSLNAPLADIKSKSAEWRKQGVTIVTCCHSGARSSAAAAVLEENGVKAINGGSWRSLQK